MLRSIEPRTWSLALVSVAPTRAVTVPVSLSWQPRMIRVRLEPFWTMCSLGPGVTTAPLRSQVIWASGGETSHWNVASSPSWTVRGVSSETSFTGGDSGRRGEAVNWVPLPPSLLISSLGLKPSFSPYSLSKIPLCWSWGFSQRPGCQFLATLSKLPAIPAWHLFPSL